jgi:hypothetical protein
MRNVFYLKFLRVMHAEYEFLRSRSLSARRCNFVAEEQIIITVRPSELRGGKKKAAPSLQQFAQLCKFPRLFSCCFGFIYTMRDLIASRPTFKPRPVD